MTPILLSVVYSSNYSSEQNELFENMLRRTSGIPDSNFEILGYSNFNEFSLSETYNKGLDKANSETILFIHVDTLFLENNWGADLVNLITDSEFGILGLAGTTELLEKRDKGAWFDTGYGNTLGLIFHPDESDGVTDLWWSDKLNFIAPAVVVDGVFLLVNKSRIKKKFDEDFKGFHFYDISFCIRNFQCGVKIGVIANHSIKLYHKSKGKLTPEWEKYRSVFLQKYPGDYIAEIALCPQQEISTSIQLNPIAKVVHIIILTKDKLNFLFDLLDSIFLNTRHQDYCVWVGDTGSVHSNKRLIRQKLRQLNKNFKVKYASRKVERGDGVDRYNFIDIGYYHYSKVNNYIVSFLETKNYCTDNDIIIFCNNDIKFLNNCIDGCLYELEKLSNEGIKTGTLGIKLLYGNNRIQHYGIDILMNENNRIFVAHNFHGHSYGNIEDRKFTIGNTGAFMLVQYHVFKTIGGFNELYDDVYQDVEFNLQCLNHGLQNVTLGNLTAYHYESQTRINDLTIRQKSSRDWRELLFPYIIHNMHLTKYFRKNMYKYKQGIYGPMVKIDFDKRLSSMTGNLIEI